MRANVWETEFRHRGRVLWMCIAAIRTESTHVTMAFMCTAVQFGIVHWDMECSAIYVSCSTGE